MREIKLPKKVDREWLMSSGLISEKGSSDLKLDFELTDILDSVAVSFFRILQKRYKGAPASLKFINISDKISELVKIVEVETVTTKKTNKGTFFERVGEVVYEAYQESLGAFSILVEMLYWGTIGLKESRDMRKGTLGEQMYQLGLRAAPIVVLMSFLIGTVLSIQAVMQLRQFGADIFLVSMITWSMVREMGPLMTAIILAGRSGSATTAEIATMYVQEEVDALKTMGINHTQFIVVPKFWAVTLTMPVLVLISIAAGIFGGFVVALLYVGLTPDLFWSEMVKNIIAKDFIISFFKSILFSWLIIWIGTYFGFKVHGGAEEVGKATTSSVVASIFIIILADALFSFVYNIQF